MVRDLFFERSSVTAVTAVYAMGEILGRMVMNSNEVLTKTMVLIQSVNTLFLDDLTVPDSRPCWKGASYYHGWRLGGFFSLVFLKSNVNRPRAEKCKRSQVTYGTYTLMVPSWLGHKIPEGSKNNGVKFTQCYWATMNKTQTSDTTGGKKKRISFLMNG